MCIYIYIYISFFWFKPPAHVPTTSGPWEGSQEAPAGSLERGREAPKTQRSLRVSGGSRELPGVILAVWSAPLDQLGMWQC